MGVMFRSNTTCLGKEELDLPVLEGYGCSDGYLICMTECLYNENMDFNDSMLKEFKEVSNQIRKDAYEAKGMFNEAANIEVVTEGVSDIVEKLKELIRKLGAKINSIYEAVKTRVMSFLTRDYNKFYNNNKDKFNRKYKNYKGNIKWMKPKPTFSGGLKFNNLNGKINTTISGTIFQGTDKLEKEQEELKDGTFLDNLLCSVCSNTDKKDFKKDFKEFLFEDKDKVEGISEDVAKEVCSILGTKDIIKNLNDAQKKNKDLFKNTLKALDEVRKKMDKNEVGTVNVDGINKVGFDSNLKNDSKRVNVIRSKVLALQTACNMINGEYISLTKRHIAQCKAVFTKVVASSVATEQTLLDSIEECAYVELLEELEVM